MSQEQLQALAESFSDDRRPAVARAADFQLLQQSIEKTLRDSGKPSAIVGKIFGFTDKHGLDAQTAGLATQIGTMLSRSPDKDSTEVAAQLLTQLALVLPLTLFATMATRSLTPQVLNIPLLYRLHR